jgi:hypothetical protein
MLIDAGEVFAMALLRMVARPELVDREGSFRVVPGRRNVARLQCFRASRRAAESAQLSLRVLIRNRSCLEKVGLHLEGVRFHPVTRQGRDGLIEQVPKRLSACELGKLFEFEPLFVSQAFGLVNEIKVGVMFERKNVNLKPLGEVARNTVDGDSAVRVVIETNPGTIGC